MENPKFDRNLQEVNALKKLEKKDFEQFVSQILSTKGSKSRLFVSQVTSQLQQKQKQKQNQQQADAEADDKSMSMSDKKKKRRKYKYIEIENPIDFRKSQKLL